MDNPFICYSDAITKPLSEESVPSRKCDWFAKLRRVAFENEPNDSTFDVPTRHAARPVETDDWM